MSSPSQPAWSMGTSKRDSDIKTGSKAIPGPGTYNAVDTSAMKLTTPNWRIGTSTRKEQKRSSTPGPGNYDPEKLQFRKAPKYTFGVRSIATDRRDTPGPGAYEAIVLKAKTKGPAYSFRGRSVDNTLINPVTDSPGPAAYEQLSTIQNKNPARVRFGSSTRDQFYLTHFTPGPGAYQIKKTGTFDVRTGPKWGFGTAGRKDLNATFQGQPGPGAYTMNTSFDDHSKGGVILARRPDSALLHAGHMPGPGAYDALNSTIGKKAPAFRMGSAARSSSIGAINDVPGPGNYDPKLGRKNLNIRIGTSTRKPLDERGGTVPGPGSYQCNISTNQGPKYGMVPRRAGSEFEGDKSQPGPGAYDISIGAVKKADPKFGIGTATRDGFYRAGAAPGPGTYDTRGRLGGPKWRFGSEGRSRSVQFHREDLPGPGAYNIPPKFANLPRYAMTASNSTATMV